MGAGTLSYRKKAANIRFPPGIYGKSAVAVLVASLLSLVYVWRVIEAAYFQAPLPAHNDKTGEAPLSMLLPTWALILANFYFGIDTSLTVGVASSAAQQLLGVSE